MDIRMEKRCAYIKKITNHVHVTKSFFSFSSLSYFLMIKLPVLQTS
jgi:hypothetical protein